MEGVVLDRVFEIVRASRKFSRLTITPTRVTVKILPSATGNDNYIDATHYVEAAKKIANNVDYPFALRGSFDPTDNFIVLSSGKIRGKGRYKNKDVFIYNFDGELIETILNKSK